MKAAVFNPYLDTMGGGERYTLGAISALEKAGYKVDLEWQDSGILKKLGERFGLKLQKTKIVDTIKRGDGYDVCFWVSDGSIPTLRSRNNILHFQVPFTKTSGMVLLNKMKLFRIKHVVVNSRFTKKFIDKTFGVNSKVIYPPVSVKNFKPRRKQNIICYIGRFSRLAQNKRHDILIDVFRKFYRGNRDWKLVLAGGVEVGNDGFTDELRLMSKKLPVEIVESPSHSEISELLGVSKMFWSAAGYGIDEEKNPEKVEHFGITVVEAMAAKCVPLVVSKGGHKEIVENGENGFLWHKKLQLLDLSEKLIRDYNLMRKLGKKANEDSSLYSEKEFASIFMRLL